MSRTTYVSPIKFRQTPACNSDRKEHNGQSWYTRGHQLVIRWILVAVLAHSAGAVCNQMPFHGYDSKYPAFPNNDAQYRQIRNDWSNKHNASFVTWLLNNEAKVVFFKIHNIITGEVQFECEVGQDELGECCVQNSDITEMSTIAKCEQAVYTQPFSNNECQLVYRSHQNSVISWDSLIVNIFVQTTQGSRRFFFGWPGKLDLLVCSEISGIGHDSSDKRLAHLLSTIEANTINYDMFFHNHLYVDPDTVITFRVRSFARPGEQTAAYLFRYDEHTKVLDRVLVEQPMKPLQVDADVRMFTERIQLMDKYESYIRQYMFRFRVNVTDRALVLMTCEQREQDLRVIDDLMYQWIIHGNRSTEFQWMHTHSPGIRLVRLSTAQYSVVTENDTIQIRIIADPQTSVICFRYDIVERDYFPTNRLKGVLAKDDPFTSQFLYVKMQWISHSDSGLYKCTDANSNEIVLHNHWIIVLPTKDQISMQVSRSMEDVEIKYGKQKPDGPILVTGKPFFVICANNLSGYYDNYDGMILTHEYGNPSHQEIVRLERNSSRLIGSRRLILYFYRVAAYFTDDHLEEQRLVCSFQYTPKIGMMRTDFFSNLKARSIQTERRVFFVTDKRPYIIGSSILTNLDNVTQFLRRLEAKSKHQLDLVVNSMKSFEGELTGEFVAVHYASSGWASVWSFSSCASTFCWLNGTQLSATHPISLMNNINSTIPVHNRVWRYEFKCSINTSTDLVVLNVFNRLSGNATKAKIMQSHQSQFCPPYDENRHEMKRSVSKRLVKDPSMYASTHRVVSFNKRSVNVEDFVVPPSIFNRYIRSTGNELLQNFIHTGESSLRAIDFHLSGSQTRWLEKNVEVSVVQNLGKPRGLTVLWTFFVSGVNAECGLERCYMLQNVPLNEEVIPQDVQQTKRYALLNGAGYVNSTFACTLRPEHVALFLITYVNVSDIQQEISNSVCNTITFWMKHPNDKINRSLLTLTSTHATYRIQRMRIGWLGSVYEGDQWQMLISHPRINYFLTNTNAKVYFECFLRRPNNELVTVYAESAEQLVTLQSDHAAEHQDTGFYSCHIRFCKSQCDLLFRTVARQLVVLPGNKSLSIYFNHDLVSSDPSTQPTDTLTLYRGQSGYIYCQHTPVPDIPDLTTVELILAASSTVTSVVPKPLPAIQVLSSSSPTLSVYDIRQNQLGREYNYLIAECVLHISTSSLNEVDLRRGTHLQPIRKRLTVQLEHSPLVNIFQSVNLENVTDLQAAIMQSTSDPLTRTDFELCISVHLVPDREHQFSLVAGLGSAHGRISAQLYSTDEQTHQSYQVACELVSMQRINRENLPIEVVEYYQETDIDEANVVNTSFRCEVSYQHWALVVTVHTDPETEEEVKGIIFEQLSNWFDDSSSEGSLENLKRQQTTFNVVRLISKDEFAFSTEPEEDLAPIVYDEDVGFHPFLFNGVDDNCG
ncbi:hypothetical protein EG68_09473 [Paragonimus skrjabini miyazakii]|uniref:Uncharacterized protein n=1 Tax=Paragonimus skrjabini miyazakii TaxID=59628 RepID=A0A8S9YCL8_9TREM|nr:hypothetical protein EG68_09473 [Paragonimus skrjabini miyazakii]